MTLTVAAHLTPGGNRRGRLALTLAVMINGYAATLQVLIHSGRITDFPHLVYTAFPVLFLTGPLMTFYVRSIIGQSPLWEKRDHLVLIPAGVALLWCLPVYSMTAEEKLSFLYSPEYRLNHIYPLLVLCCVNFGFILYLNSTINHFHLKAQRLLSDISQLKLRWLKLILNVGILIWMARLGWIAIIQLGLGFETNSGFLYLTPSLVALGFLILTIGAIQQSSFLEVIERQGIRQSEIEECISLPPLNGPDPQMGRLLEKIRSTTANEGLYLDPELSLPKLAHRVEAPIYLVSKALNRHGGLTFYDFINDFRVEAAKKNLMDPQSTHLSILALAEESGFRSKSVFNEIFKKRTGLTPSEFRRKAQNTSASANPDA